MSRIGKSVINVPDNVNLSINQNEIKAKGPKGELFVKVPEGVNFNFENKVLTFSRTSDDKKLRALHGLTRALASNMIEGVDKGFSRTLKIEGVGYKVEIKNGRLFMNMGYSHPVLIIPPTGVSIEAPNPTTIIVSGFDKQLVGEVCATVRGIRPPEPYKGKGIRFEGEYVRRKAGKTSAK
jgi:large subunit ribosomal protein L6